MTRIQYCLGFPQEMIELSVHCSSVPIAIKHYSCMLCIYTNLHDDDQILGRSFEHDAPVHAGRHNSDYTIAILSPTHAVEWDNTLA